MAAQKNVKTPGATILVRLGVGKACTLEIPFNDHYPVVELPGLPQELGFPLASPRAYSVVNMEKSGPHAHLEGTEQEIMYVVAGRATIYIWDRDGKCAIVELEPAKEGERFRGVFIPDGLMHTVIYEQTGTVLNVVASTVYDRSCYIEAPAEYFTEEGLPLYESSCPN